jgi:hypothetical protein
MQANSNRRHTDTGASPLDATHAPKHGLTPQPTSEAVAAARLEVKAILGLSDEDWSEACAAMAELAGHRLPLLPERGE